MINGSIDENIGWVDGTDSDDDIITGGSVISEISITGNCCIF